MTNIESIIGHRIDKNGGVVPRGQRHIPGKNWPKYPPLDLNITTGVLYWCRKSQGKKIKTETSSKTEVTDAIDWVFVKN